MRFKNLFTGQDLTLKTIQDRTQVHNECSEVSVRRALTIILTMHNQPVKACDDNAKIDNTSDEGHKFGPDQQG